MRTKKQHFYVYIATNKSNTVLYTGVTSNLVQRMGQHKEKIMPGFTSRYNINKLVYFEVFDDAENALHREKQLKAGSRQRKLDLILATNPCFEDLYDSICG